MLRVSNNTDNKMKCVDSDAPAKVAEFSFVRGLPSPPAVVLIFRALKRPCRTRAPALMYLGDYHTPSV